MWIPKNERKLLVYYYRQLQKIDDRGIELDETHLINILRLLKILPKDDKLETGNSIKNNAGYSKISRINEFLLSRQLITWGFTHKTQDSFGQPISEWDYIRLTTQGHDMASKYAKWFSNLTLWWQEHRVNPIWIILGFLISFLAGIFSTILINYLTVSTMP